ncbi:hypothetical protein [Atopobium sp. oral taxon 199]|uniref:hypothetical protein n=1 Tax=Atopobium sp. oral taxon 199 TaxID=712156 RepID=UPI00034E0A1F|nr:hypothetical protein [Atopobium sp. oral taxon 199]EPD77091.1 hypothetical protein HMPREF1527_01512 [Atopobium sp. oral taxon 199 str. F0494]
MRDFDAELEALKEKMNAVRRDKQTAERRANEKLGKALREMFPDVPDDASKLRSISKAGRVRRALTLKFRVRPTMPRTQVMTHRVGMTFRGRQGVQRGGSPSRSRRLIADKSDGVLL